MRSAAAIFLLSILNISAVAQVTADLVLVRANIRTMGGKTPIADALAVAGGKIVAVGKDRDVRKLISSRTRVIDAAGKLVLPGFNDAHVHFTGIGNLFSHLDARGDLSRAQLLRKISDYAAVLPKGRWIIGAGLKHEKLGSREYPSLGELDQASPDNPLIIYAEKGRSLIANSAAMKMAAISTATRFTGPGVIGQDGNQKLTGIFTETAVRLIQKHIPADHATNWAEIAETAGNYAVSLGVTSIQDVHSDDLLQTYLRLDKSGRLKTRVYECVGIQNWQKAVAVDAGLVRGGCVKGTSHGIPEEVDELTQHIKDSDKAGLQVMIHAIGRRSMQNTLDAFEHASRTNGKRDRRFRIEHAARMDDSDIPRLARLNIIASMQPHLFYYPGEEEGDNYRGLLTSGVRLAFGSDASITDLDPLLGIQAAVTSGKQSLTVYEAVRAYTFGSAYAEFQEHIKGTLEVGKAADFVILSEDIFSMDPRRIAESKVLLTTVNGKIVYDTFTTSSLK